MLVGVLPIVYAILIIIVLLSAARQLWKGFRVSKFIPWLFCAAFILYAANNTIVFETLGAIVWKLASALLSHVNIPKA